MKALCLERCTYLVLQLVDSDRQVENQQSHILQLALQQLNGLSLTLVLWENKDNKLSNHTHIDIIEMACKRLYEEIFLKGTMFFGQFGAVQQTLNTTLVY